MLPFKFSNISDQLNAVNRLDLNEDKYGVCTTQWNGRSVGFKCHDCQNDESCVICVECFFDSNHEGHDTELMLPEAGCCDCGDTSSWAAEGCCSRHRGLSEANFQALVEAERALLVASEATGRRDLTEPIRIYVQSVAERVRNHWSGEALGLRGRIPLEIDGEPERHIEELTKMVEKSFWFRYVAETYLFDDTTLRHIFGRRCGALRLVRRVVKLLLTLMPRLGFKKRCGKIAIRTMAQRYSVSDPPSEVMDLEEGDMDVGCLAVQMFTVEEIAEDAMRAGYLDELLESFDLALRRERAGNGKLDKCLSGRYARYLACVLGFIVSAVPVAELATYFARSKPLTDYLARYYLANEQERARVHVEYELEYEPFFGIESRVLGRLGPYFAHCQKAPDLLHGITIAERVWQQVCSIERLGVSFHLGLLRVAVASMPIDLVLAAVASKARLLERAKISLTLEPTWQTVDPEQFVRLARLADDCTPIKHVVRTMSHTYAAQSCFWRRNGQNMMTQTLEYSRSFHYLRLDTAVLLLLLFMRRLNLAQAACDPAHLLTPLFSCVLFDRFESVMATTLPRPPPEAVPLDLQQWLIHSWEIKDRDARFDEIQATVDHRTTEGALFRLLTLWEILVTLCDWAVRNLEIYATSSAATLAPEEFERLKMILAAEFIWRITSTKMQRSRAAWDLPYPIPAELFTKYSVSSSSDILSVSPDGYEFLSRPTLQGFSPEKSDVEAVLADLGDRVDLAGVSWATVRGTPADVNEDPAPVPLTSWAGKTLLTGALLAEAGLSDLCWQLLNFLTSYQFLQAAPATADGRESQLSEECTSWERSTIEELVMCVCRVAASVLIPLWTDREVDANLGTTAASPATLACSNDVERLHRALSGVRATLTDGSVIRCLDATLRRLNTLIGTFEEVSAGVRRRRSSGPAPEEKAESIRLQQLQILESYKAKQTAFWGDLGEDIDLSDEEDDNGIAGGGGDDYLHDDGPLITKLRQCTSTEDRTTLELHPRGTHTCAVCHEGPTLQNFLVVFLNLELCSLLQRMIFDPVVGEETKTGFLLPLSGTALAEEDLPRRSGNPSTCGHAVHRRCVSASRELYTCPICRAKSQFMLPMLPAWGLLAQESTEYPFYWHEAMGFEGEHLPYRVNYSTEPVSYRVLDGDVWTVRGGEATGDGTSGLAPASRVMRWAYRQIPAGRRARVTARQLIRLAREQMPLPAPVAAEIRNADTDARLQRRTAAGENSPLTYFFFSEAAAAGLRPVPAGVAPGEGGGEGPTLREAAAQTIELLQRMEAQQPEAEEAEERQSSLSTDDEEERVAAEADEALSEASSAEPPVQIGSLETLEGVSEDGESAAPESAEANSVGDVGGVADDEAAAQPFGALWGPENEPRGMVASWWWAMLIVENQTAAVPPPELDLLNDERFEGLTRRFVIGRHPRAGEAAPGVGGVPAYVCPEDRGLSVTHQINIKSHCLWAPALEGWSWMTRHRLTALFYATYLELLRTGRHNPVAISVGQTTASFCLYAQLLRNLCLVHPAIDSYPTAISGAKEWRWPAAHHVNHTEQFLVAFVRHVQDGRPFTELLALARLQVVMLVCSTAYNYLTQKLKAAHAPTDHLLDGLARDFDAFALGGADVSLTIPARHVEISLRHLEAPGYLTRCRKPSPDPDSAPAPEESDDDAVAAASDAKKARSRAYYPMIWRSAAAVLAKAGSGAMRPDQLDEIVGTGEPPLGLPAELGGHPLDRLHREAFQLFHTHNRATPHWDLLTLFDDAQARGFAALPSDAPSAFKDHLEQLWRAACEQIDVTGDLVAEDWESLETNLVEVLLDFLTFVFTTFSGVLRFESAHQRLMNQLAFPVADGRAQLSSLLAHLPAGDSAARSFTLQGFTESACFRGVTAQALGLLWDRAEVEAPLPQHIIPLPRVRRQLLTPDDTFVSKLQRRYKMGPGLQLTFYACVRQNFRRFCAICQNVPELSLNPLICMVCGVQVCFAHHCIFEHSAQCFGGTGAYAFWLRNTCLLTAHPQHLLLKAEPYKELYKRPTARAQDGPLDTALIDRLYTQLITSSILKWL